MERLMTRIPIARWPRDMPPRGATGPMFVAAVGAVLLWHLAAAYGGDSKLQHPNIVFIMADDLGWSDLACFGADLHRTPNIDRLARQSVRFTDAYAASPVCTPTRASILTGKYPARLHMTIWREAALNRGHRKLLEPVTRADLPREETTLAELLQQHGYYTAHIGKWHLGSASYYPQAHGFHINIGGTLWGAPQTYFYPFRGQQYYSDWRYVPDLEPGKPGDYLTDRLTDEALRIIEQNVDRPFFLQLWFHSVHTPIEGKRKLVKRFAGRAGNARHHRNPHYAAMVASVDQNVGRVLARLKDTGLADRTIVVFFSDNGGYVGESRLQPGLPVTSNAPLRSGKGSLYEGGIRVPLIVRLPRSNRSGTVCHTPVISCDLLPTLLTLAGLANDIPHDVDGIDISPLFENPQQPLPRDALFFHYPHYYPTTTPVSAVRQGKWKLLHYYEDDHVELYDLASDLSETHDLAMQRPMIARRLKARLDEWRGSMRAQEPQRRGENR